MSMWIGPKMRVYLSGVVTGFIIVGLGLGVTWGRLDSLFGRSKAAAETFTQDPAASTTLPAPTDTTIVVQEVRTGG